MSDNREALIRAVQEPEWEYAWAGAEDGEDWVTDDVFNTVTEAQSFARTGRGWIQRQGGSLHRRHPAGPWVPVE